MGRLCERVCRSEGGANDEEEWSYIDAPKGGKGGRGLMEKLNVEQNGRTLGCDGVFGEKKKLGEGKCEIFFLPGRLESSGGDRGGNDLWEHRVAWQKVRTFRCA